MHTFPQGGQPAGAHNERVRAWLLAPLALVAGLAAAAPVPDVEPGGTATWIFRLERGQVLEAHPRPGFELLSSLPKQGPGYAAVTVRVPEDARAGVREAVTIRLGEEKERTLRVRVRFLPQVELECRQVAGFLELSLVAKSNATARYHLRLRGRIEAERLVQLPPGQRRTYVFRPPAGGGVVRVEAWVEGARADSLQSCVASVDGGGGARAAPEFGLRGELSGAWSWGREPRLSFSLAGPLSDYLETGVRFLYPQRFFQLWGHSDAVAGSLFVTPGALGVRANVEAPEGNFWSFGGGYYWSSGERLYGGVGYQGLGTLVRGEFVQYAPGAWVLGVVGARYSSQGGIFARVAWDGGKERLTTSLYWRQRLGPVAFRVGGWRQVDGRSGGVQARLNFGLSYARQALSAQFEPGPEPRWRFTLTGALTGSLGYRAELDGERGGSLAFAYREGGWSVALGAQGLGRPGGELLGSAYLHPLPLFPKGVRAELRWPLAGGSPSARVRAELGYPLSDGELRLNGALGLPLTGSSLGLSYRLGDDTRYLDLAGRYAPLRGFEVEVAAGAEAPEWGRGRVAVGYGEVQGWRVEVEGAWRFQLPVPDEVVTWAGGTRSGILVLCLEGEGEGKAIVGLQGPGAERVEVPLGSCRDLRIPPGTWLVHLLALPPGVILSPDVSPTRQVRLGESETARVTYAALRGGAMVVRLRGEEVPPRVLFVVEDPAGRRIRVEAKEGSFRLAPLLPGTYTVRPAEGGVLPRGLRIQPRVLEVKVPAGGVAEARFEVKVERLRAEESGVWQVTKVEFPYAALPPGSRVPVKLVLEGEGSPPAEVSVWYREVRLGVLERGEGGVYKGWIQLPNQEGAVRLRFSAPGVEAFRVLRLDPKAPWGVATGFGLLAGGQAEVRLLFFAPARGVRVEAKGPVESVPERMDREGYRWKIRFALTDARFKGMISVRIVGELEGGHKARLGGLLFAR